MKIKGEHPTTNIQHPTSNGWDCSGARGFGGELRRPSRTGLTTGDPSPAERGLSQTRAASPEIEVFSSRAAFVPCHMLRVETTRGPRAGWERVAMWRGDRFCRMDVFKSAASPRPSPPSGMEERGWTHGTLYRRRTRPLLSY